MYALRINGINCIKKAKGVKGSVVATTIDFDDYLVCLSEGFTQYRTQHLFRSHLHNIQTIRQKKLALSPYYDKRIILAETTDTLPHGHYQTRESEMIFSDEEETL